MLKIRLMRIGGKQRPFYRVVVVDERAKRTGGYIELLGTYNPLTEPKDIKLKKDRIEHWIKQGAQPSVGYLRIIGQAPQRPPRKPKKEKKEEPKLQKEAKSEEVTPEQPEVTEVKSETEEAQVSKPTDSETGEIKTEPESGENKEVVDDSAESTKSEEIESSESVQKKNEGSA